MKENSEKHQKELLLNPASAVVLTLMLKEYKNDKLIFEGEYINNRRKEGIEYDYTTGKVIFQGNYLN